MVGEQAPMVVQVVSQGPAAMAGIREGDVLVNIDGKDTAELSAEERVASSLGYATLLPLHTSIIIECGRG